MSIRSFNARDYSRAGWAMTDPETNARLETLEAHVAKLEAIVDVLLEQIEAGIREDMLEAIRPKLRGSSE
jgi:hypothetical protein